MLFVNWGIQNVSSLRSLKFPGWTFPALGQAPREGGDTHLLALGALQTSDAVCPLRKQRRKVSSHKPEPLQTPQKTGLTPNTRGA